MNQDRLNSIADVPAITGELKKVLNGLKDVKEFIDSVGKIEITAKGANKFSETAKATRDMSKALKEFENVQKQVEIASLRLQKVQTELAKQSALLAKTSVETAKAEKEEAKAAQEVVKVRLLEQKLASELAKEKERAARATERERKAAEKAANAYTQLSQATAKATLRAKDIAVRFGETSKQAKIATAEAKRLNDRLAAIDRSVGQYGRNVGNYSSAFNGLWTNIKMFGASLLSVTSIVKLFNSVIDVSSKYESLNSAIKAVTGSQQEYAAVQNFLTVTADKYGQDLEILTTTYKGLAAAARGTSLEGQETRKIFESIIQAGTTLKLSNEQVEGSFLAIQQMISKGKVSAEELRGQLGERLPGAFGLFAKSLGVSTAKLDEMLKKGEVLSSDALPKFAAELTKAYGEDAVKNANALVNETNRLNNAVDQLLLAFAETSGIKEFWATFKRGLADGLNEVTAFLKNPSIGLFLDSFFGGSKLKIKVATEQARAKAVESFRGSDQGSQLAIIRKEAEQTKKIQSALRKADTEEEKKRLTNNLKLQTEYLSELLSIYKAGDQQRKINAERAAKELEGLNKDKKAKAPKTKKEEIISSIDSSVFGLSEQLGIEYVKLKQEELKRFADYVGFRKELQQKLASELAGIGDEILDRRIKKIEEEYDRETSVIIAGRDERLAKQAQAFADGLITEEQYGKNRLRIENEANAALLSAQIRYYEAQLPLLEKGSKKRQDAEQALAAARKALGEFNAELANKPEDGASKTLDKLIEKLQYLRDTLQEVGDVIGGLIDAQTTKQKNAIQEQIDGLDQRTESEIAAVNATVATEQEKADRIAIINAKAAAEKNRLEQEQRRLEERKLQFEKKLTIAQIILNTALAVTEYLKEKKYAQAIAAGVLGAAKLAVAIATPIPKYKHGREKGPAEFAVVGDGGRQEVISSPDMKQAYVTPATDTLTYLPKDWMVHKSVDAFIDKSKGAAHRNIPDMPIVMGGDNRDMINAMAREIGGLKQAITKIPVNNFYIKNGDLQRMVQEGINRTNYLNW